MNVRNRVASTGSADGESIGVAYVGSENEQIYTSIFVSSSACTLEDFMFPTRTDVMASRRQLEG